ncbi:hypothetical protein ABPG72_015332 [Tetrahymena utriculariae]
MKMIMKKSPSVSLSSAVILNEEEIQPLQQNEQRKRVFVIGSLRRMREFIEYIKSRQNLHKSSQIDGDDDDEQQHGKQQCKRGYIGSVSFKYPVKGSKIRQLLEESRGFLSKKKVAEDENNNMVEEEEEEEEYDDMVKLYTHSDPYYDLIKLKSSSSINSSEQLGRLRNSSSVTSSSSSSNSISSQFIQGNHSSNNNSESVSLLLQHMELKQQLVEIQRQQMHQNQAQTELMQNLLLAMKEPSYSQNQYKKEQQQQQKQQQQHPEDCSRRRIEEEGNDHNSNTNTNTSNNNNNKIFERINEMIVSEGIFEYPELRKALQREGYQDQGILTTFVNNKHYIDTLIEIFKPKNVAASYQYVQQQQTQASQQYQQNQQNQQQETQQYTLVSFNKDTNLLFKMNSSSSNK